MLESPAAKAMWRRTIGAHFEADVLMLVLLLLIVVVAKSERQMKEPSLWEQPGRYLIVVARAKPVTALSATWEQLPPCLIAAALIVLALIAVARALPVASFEVSWESGGLCSRHPLRRHERRKWLQRAQGRG
jgi:hypothetical protein